MNRFARLLHVAQALLPAHGAQRRPGEAGGERREAGRRPEAKGQRSKQANGDEQAAADAFRPFVPHSALRIPHSAFRVSRSANAGYSLVEMLAAVVIFGIFLMVLVGLQRQFLRFDGEMRVALFTHPSPFAVLARLRHDILDSRGFPAAEGTWTQSPATLLLDTVGDDGSSHVVVWDFSTPVIARRIELKAGQQIAAWEARAVPRYRIGNWEAPDGRTGVLVTATDGEGNVVVDQIVTPRAR